MRKLLVLLCLALALGACARGGLHSRGVVVDVFERPAGLWVTMGLPGPAGEPRPPLRNFRVEPALYHEFEANIGATYDYDTQESGLSEFVVRATKYEGGR